MRIAALLALVLTSAGVAHAAPRAIDYAVTDRVQVQADDETVDLVPQARDVRLDQPVRLELPLLPHPDAAVQSIDLRMGVLPPDEMVLTYDVSPAVTVYVSADLDDELPRLDAMDGDTYFTVGAELHVTPTFSVIVEDFQPASMIVGGRDDVVVHPVPARSWDGHEVSIGARWRVGDRVTLEGAAVLHVLSASHRPTSVGALTAVRVSY